jgi:hypothetical protein
VRKQARVKKPPKFRLNRADARKKNRSRPNVAQAPVPLWFYSALPAAAIHHLIARLSGFSRPILVQRPEVIGR